LQKGFPVHALAFSGPRTKPAGSSCAKNAAQAVTPEQNKLLPGKRTSDEAKPDQQENTRKIF